ncbi:MAG: hypothetical protein ACRED1_15775 [Limisphaerales bacterium]
MTLVEKMAELKVFSNKVTSLVVDPGDITFDDLDRDTVVLRVQVRNDSERRSSHANVRLESAPFGAFVPSSPLAILPVPALEPGQSRELNVTVARPHPAPLGAFDRVPPGKVLAAVQNSSDEPPRKSGGMAALWSWLRRSGRAGASRDRAAAGRPALSADLWELFGREQPHWAGNINVFVGTHAAERHVAKALRVYSGRTNLAMFVVGGPGKGDAYRFDLIGLPMDWKAMLYDVTGAKALVMASSDKPVGQGQWARATGMMLVILAVRPPVVCEEGRVRVHVTRQSCGETAVVEFDLDPTAQGAGCYIA